MTENPVGTKAKRAALVYLHGAEVPPFYSDRTLREVIHYSRTGLDIAEEMARAEQVVEWVVGREAYVLLDRDLKWWRYWRIAAAKARWGALSKWAEWKGEGGGD